MDWMGRKDRPMIAPFRDFRRRAEKRKRIVASLLLGAALSCGPAGSQPPTAVAAPIPGEAKAAQDDGQAQLNGQIVKALQDGRFADANGSARNSRAAQAEVDFAVGELILQGLADPAAAQRPVESLDEAILLIEKSALSGHRPAISSLAATYYTGLRGGATGSELIAPDAPLHACWEAAKSDPTHSRACVEMRLRR